jgi:hypothetical protein
MSVVRILRRLETDPQREALYQAERSISSKPFFRPQMTRAQTVRLIKRVRKQYALVPITLRVMSSELPTVDHGRYDVIYDGDTHELEKVTISVNPERYGMNPALVLHELSHVICDQTFGMDIPDHGAELVGVMVWLYDHYNLIPEDAFRLILRRYKVKHKSLAESSPAAIKGIRKCSR